LGTRGLRILTTSIADRIQVGKTERVISHLNPQSEQQSGISSIMTPSLISHMININVRGILPVGFSLIPRENRVGVSCIFRRTAFTGILSLEDIISSE
jgi:hypothetical protein